MLKIRKKLRKNYLLNKLYYLLTYRRTNPKLDIKKIDKVFFVAHPDDEIIFFSKELLNNSRCLVVCMTNGGNWIRQKEFISVMNLVGAQYKMLNFKDGYKIKWDEKNLIKAVSSILNLNNNWSMVATHNKDGEYGHYQHKELNRIISKLYKNGDIYVPINESKLITEQNKLTLTELEEKKSIIKNYYKSQKVMLCFRRFVEYEGVEKNNII